MSDMQKVRDAIEAAGLPSIGGSGPMRNDLRSGKRVIKLVEAGYFTRFPQTLQWAIRDNVAEAFGKRFLGIYLVPGKQGPMIGGQHAWSLCIDLRK